jgi:hypothetical protein
LHRWRMALSGLVILIAGITLGAAGAVLVIRPADPQPPLDITRAVADMVGRFRDDLNLTPEQVDKIRTILKTRMEALEALRKAARPKIEELLQSMKADVEAVLTKEQKEKWQEITEGFDRVFHRGLGPGGRGGPGRGGPGGDFRGGGRRFGPGDRSDANDPRRFGERRFGAFDPNEPRRPGGPRPDWQRQDFERRSPGRRFDVNDSPPPPEYGDGPMDPGSMSPGPGSP